MKIFLFPILLVIPILFVTGQNKSDPSVKSKMEFIVTEIGNNKKSISKRDYYTMKVEYDEIAFGMNDAYRKVARRVSRGYTILKGDKVTKRNKDISDQIASLEDRANNYYRDKLQFLIEINSDEELEPVHADASIVLGAIALLKLALDELTEKACLDAKEFYDESRWRSFEEITGEKVHIKDYSFLTDCN